MILNEVSEKACLEAGWPEFAITHSLRIGYSIFFTKLNGKDYKVVVFDYSCYEMVGTCP
jgi:hypothetical protein